MFRNIFVRFIIQDLWILLPFRAWRLQTQQKQDLCVIRALASLDLLLTVNTGLVQRNGRRLQKSVAALTFKNLMLVRPWIVYV